MEKFVKDALQALEKWFEPILGTPEYGEDMLSTETPVNADIFCDEEDTALLPAQVIRATIKSARREMDPATLQGWSRVIFDCEDGEERKMYFPGENGVYLMAGENGYLEHRDGMFISFEKDSGEIVGAMYHIMPGEEE